MTFVIRLGNVLLLIPLCENSFDYIIACIPYTIYGTISTQNYNHYMGPII